MKNFKEYLKEIGFKELDIDDETTYAESNRKYREAVDNWYKDLREEWSHIPDEIFNICYSYAKPKSNGFDETALIFSLHLPKNY